MKNQVDTKIQTHHLKRKALIYVRQSTMRQVLENAESTARQYGLVDRATDLGWTKTLIEVIDEDLGKSGSSSSHRSGFQKLVADVAMGQVGIVMGLEMSRLARNNADFQQLLQICGANNTLIYDADAVYDLMRLNDRLILGLKGTMSEVELFTIRARLQGGALNKALRAELKVKLPIGFIYSPTGDVTLDPDRQVQETLGLFFKTFQKTGSAKGIVRYFNSEGIAFPVRPVKGNDKGQLVWRSLSSGLALRILHNPRYAGAYSYGRTKVRKSPSGGVSYSKRGRDDWHSLVKDAHPGYISWERFEQIQERLAANACRDFQSPTREGCGLLQGITICGKCGRHFATSYKKKANGEVAPIYLCNREQLDYGKSICTYIPGSGIDESIADVLLDKMTPVAVDAALAVQKEIMKRAEETDKLLRRHVERAKFEADLARRRVISVDPENRLVAQTFEDEWNEKLNLLEQAKIDYEKKHQDNRQILEVAQHDEIKNSLADFNKIWTHHKTTNRDKKRLIRLLIEDVTLKRDGYEVAIFIRFKTGTIVEKSYRLCSSGSKATEIDSKIIETIKGLADGHTAGQIAAKLNDSGVVHPTIGRFDTNAVVYLFQRFKLLTRKERLITKGFLSQEEIADRYGVTTHTVRRWRLHGWISAVPYNDKPEFLYEPTLKGLPEAIARQYESRISAR